MQKGTLFSFLSLAIVGVLSGFLFLLVHEHWQMESLIRQLHELNNRYQDRINRCEEFISQQSLAIGITLPFSSVIEPESLLPLNRNINYLQSAAYDFFKQNSMEQLWDGMVNSFVPLEQTKVVKKTVQSRKKRVVTAKKINRLSTSNAFLHWPILNELFWISSWFGKRKNRDGSIGFHYGIDLAALKGTPVLAAADGLVIDARYAEGYGNVIVIKHTSRMSTKYAHLHKIHVRVGTVVKRGQRIGLVGETGFIRKQTKDGSHLHFEVCDDKKRIDPLLLLPAL
jgi:murein DD-endopeptidase MepM/ murein hydrolase activator NlpD